ncbi:MAG TPA: MbnP family protein [Flavipsychrobacter sp.]|nr:MbnP family protein [Flavipsychrobacter sp.]
MKKLGLLFLILLQMAACTKKPDIVVDSTPKGKISITIENYAGTQILKLNDVWYKNENGDSLQISVFNYFISNIKLTRDDGFVYAEPESYHLVRENNLSTKSFTIENVPPGNYKTISFMIGVDSTHNVSGAQTGDLDPNTGMFWDWNTGYIMAKLEGKSPASSGGIVLYHLGGYSGANNAIRTVSFNQDLALSDKQSKTIHLKADVLEWFRTPTTIKIKEIDVVSANSTKIIADNYADMFTIDHID